MPLQLLRLEESEMDANSKIMFASFGPDLMTIMYPNGWTQADLDHSIKESTTARQKHKDDVVYTKVIDTDLPADDPYKQIIGTAKWQIYAKERSEEELEQERQEAAASEPGPGADTKMLEAFFGAISRARAEHMGGKPYVLLSILATLPQHHRRGVGAMHLKHGLAMTDELGLPAWLEASPKGKPLYERYGFEAVGDLDFQAADYGASADLQHVLMLRPAQKK